MAFQLFTPGPPPLQPEPVPSEASCRETIEAFGGDAPVPQGGEFYSSECWLHFTRFVAWLSCEPALKYCPLIYAWRKWRDGGGDAFFDEDGIEMQESGVFCKKEITPDEHVYEWNQLRFALAESLGRKLSFDRKGLLKLRALQNHLATCVLLWEEYTRARFSGDPQDTDNNSQWTEAVVFWRQHWFKKSVSFANYVVTALENDGLVQRGA